MIRLPGPGWGLLISISMVVLTGCNDNKPTGAKLTPPPNQPPAVPKKVAQPLDDSLLKQSRNQIDLALHSNDPLQRAHAVEALKLGPGKAAQADIIRCLSDDAPMVRFASAMSCGELKLDDAKTALLRLRDDADHNVRVAVRYALYQLGEKQYLREILLLSADPDPWVRANSVLALGMMGDEAALPRLRRMQRDRTPAVRVQIPEAMWRLGDKIGLESLVAQTISRYPDDQILGYLGLGSRRDQRMRGQIRGGLVAEYTEVALAAARAMGMLGSDEGYGVALAGTKSADPRQRVLAAMALGAIGRSDAQGVLGPLLQDTDPDVRLAAASAILQLRP